MSTLIFDTHKFVTEMTNVGMPQPQAEALAKSHVKLMENTLATKQDLKDLEGRLTSELTSKIDKAKIETIGIITAVMVGLAAIMAFFMAYLQAAK